MPTKMSGKFRTITAAIGLSAALAGAPAVAQDDVSSFYQGRTVTIYVGFAPGGGTDMYGRLVADHLGKHLPGNPTVIVENMPGGGGVRAAQHVYAAAPQDGSVLALFVQTLAASGAAGAIPGVDDVTQYGAVGRLDSVYQFGFSWHDTGVESFEDTLTQPVIFGSTGAGSASFIIPTMLNEMMGAKYDIIAGYDGIPSLHLALEAGEIDAMMDSPQGLASRPELLAENKINLLWQMANQPHPDHPDVPVIGQMGETEDEKAVFRIIASSTDIGRAFFTTPNVPEERLQALRAAFDSMIADPAFVEDLERRGLTFDPASGEELAEIVRSALQISPAAVEKLKSYLGQ